MDPFSSISNIGAGGGAGAIGNQFGGAPQLGGPQSPKAILQALLAKLGMAQQQGAPGGGGQCACGGSCGGGQAGCSCGCSQRTNGLGF
jgi:hypothetical protein